MDAFLIPSQCLIYHAIYSSCGDSHKREYDPTNNLKVRGFRLRPLDRHTFIGCFVFHSTLTPSFYSRLRHITSALFIILAVYAALYGVTYAYLLHHIANIVTAWLVGVHFTSSGFSLRNLNQALEGSGFGDDGPLGIDGHTKKLP